MTIPAAHSIQARIGIGVICGDHDQGVGIALLKLQTDIDRLIECDLVANRCGSIGIVRGMIDPGTLDLKNESILLLEAG